MAPSSPTLRTALILCVIPCILIQLRYLSMTSKSLEYDSVSSSLPTTIRKKYARVKTNDNPTSNNSATDNRYTQNFTTAKSSITVDILSVGSINRIDYLEAQRETIGRHVSVRNFWGVTELDDVDQSCYKNLTWPDVQSICNFCTSKVLRLKQPHVLQKMTVGYARQQFLAKKKNPAGWMCAQRRPFQGLQKKALMKYRDGSVTIPDYLLIMDDDTYVDMTMFEDNFSGNATGTYNQLTSSDATATAGCRVLFAYSTETNFSFPFGGYGYYLSKAAIQRLIEPVFCGEDGVNNPPRSSACSQIHEDMFQEAQYFRNGMSVSDLMYEYTVAQPYGSVQNWTTGFCLHSDWIWGMLNFYNISDHLDDTPSKRMKDVQQSRLGAYLLSGIYTGNQNQPGKRICDLQNSNCHSRAPVCHYSNPTRMRILTELVESRSPDKFRPAAISAAPKRDDLVFDMIVSSEFQRNMYSKHMAIRRIDVLPDATNGTSCRQTLKDRKTRCNLESKSSKPDCNGHIVQGFIDTTRKYSNDDRLMPDFLVLLMEKSTYFNMEAIQDHLKFASAERKDERNAKPLALSMCVDANSEAFEANTGLIANRGAIERLSRPIRCKGGDVDTQGCEMIDKNRHGEKDLFQEGMSLIDLLEREMLAMNGVNLSRADCTGSTRLLSAYINYFVDPPSTVPDPEQEKVLPSTNVLQPMSDSAFCKYSDFLRCPPEAMACSGLTEDEMRIYSSGLVESEKAWQQRWFEFRTKKVR